MIMHKETSQYHDQARMAAQAQADRLADQQRAIDEAADMLSVNETSILPESIFVKFYLPYFSGQISASETTDPKEKQNITKHIQELVSAWVGVAGGPQLGVAIVSDSNHKEVLYVVPPIFSTQHFDALPRGRHSIMDRIREYEQQRNASPVAASVNLTTHLAIKASHMARKGVYRRPDATSYHDDPAWVAIFERYGIKRPTSSTAETASQDDPSMDFIFD